MISNLEKLWNITGIQRSFFPERENLFFDPIGLILLTELKHHGYWCTPINTVTFAKTGGDGVHFGFLCGSEMPNENQPIVMTLPCADNCNIIVAESFIEFLSLGCRSGYFDLEQIEYRPEKHIAQLDTQCYSQDASEHEIKLLKIIESEFSLKPWTAHANRFLELEALYFSTLKYSDEYHEIIT